MTLEEKITKRNAERYARLEQIEKRIEWLKASHDEADYEDYVNLMEERCGIQHELQEENLDG